MFTALPGCHCSTNRSLCFARKYAREKRRASRNILCPMANIWAYLLCQMEATVFVNVQIYDGRKVVNENLFGFFLSNKKNIGCIRRTHARIHNSEQNRWDIAVDLCSFVIISFFPSIKCCLWSNVKSTIYWESLETELKDCRGIFIIECFSSGTSYTYM